MHSKEPADAVISDLMIEDLFIMPDAERPSRQSGPYAIDLCVSAEPASMLAPSLRQFGHLHAYQVTDWHGDCLVFRLRLGPIGSEIEAESMLAMVQADYPDAATLAIGADDLRMIELVAASATTRVTNADVAKSAAPKAEPPARTEPVPPSRREKPAPPAAAAADVRPPTLTAMVRGPRVAPATTARGPAPAARAAAATDPPRVTASAPAREPARAASSKATRESPSVIAPSHGRATEAPSDTVRQLAR